MGSKSREVYDHEIEGASDDELRDMLKALLHAVQLRGFPLEDDTLDGYTIGEEKAVDEHNLG